MASFFPRSGGRDVARLEAFTDGVFAIAITLLVLDIHVPAAETLPEGVSLWAALVMRWPNFLAYVVTFGILGIMWANHHDLCHLISRVDRTLVMLNLALLMMIAVQPFTTALVSEYLRDPERGPCAVQIYAGTLTITALIFCAFWYYAAKGHRLIRPDAPTAAVRSINRRFYFGPVIYAVATAIAFASPLASLLIMGVLALAFVFPYAVESP